MKGIDTSTAGAVPDPDGTPGCAAGVDDRTDSTPPWLSERVREAWLAHWDRVPDWVWTADHVWDTDHRCTETCLADITRRFVR